MKCHVLASVKIQNKIFQIVFIVNRLKNKLSTRYLSNALVPKQAPPFFQWAFNEEKASKLISKVLNIAIK